MTAPNELRRELAESGLREGLDYELEDGLVVLSAAYLRSLGQCCACRCRNCPWRSPRPARSGAPHRLAR